MPLVARDRLAGGPLVYGLLLGAFGLGALAGAFVVHRLRRRYGAERALTVLAGVFGGALLVLGLVPSLLAPVIVALALAGAAWLGSFSTFNIAVQMTTAFWVQARALALYQATIFGAAWRRAAGSGARSPVSPASKQAISPPAVCCCSALPASALAAAGQ